jgi:hypothetical protein
VGTLVSALTFNVVLSGPSANASLGSLTTATITIVNAAQIPPPATLVTVNSVKVLKNRRNMVSQILVGFSGGLDPTEAASTSEYRLVMAGKGGSFTAKSARTIKLRSASYNPATNTVTLTLKAPVALTARAQFTVFGQPPSGLDDSYGRLIDGNHDGQAGGNAVAILTSKSVTLSAVKASPAAIDVLLEHGKLTGLTKSRRK